MLSVAKLRQDAMYHAFIRKLSHGWFYVLVIITQGEFMNYLERALESSLRHVGTISAADPGTVGLLRESAVLAIVGTFRVSSKSVIQHHLGISREAVNKLINRMKKKQLIVTHPTFANTDNGYILLTSRGIREAEFLLNRELHLRSDASRINERNLIHDLSVQLVVLNLVKQKKVAGFASESDLAVTLEHRGNDPRLVDAIVVDAITGVKIGIEMETSNAKNKSNTNLRQKILAKYLQEFESSDGLYDFVYMYSHRQRFLTQIEKAHARIFASSQSPFSETQQRTITTCIKFRSSDCDLIYELMFNSKRLLKGDKTKLNQKNDFLNQLAELEKLATTTDDRVIEIRLAGYRDAGRVLGFLE